MSVTKIPLVAKYQKVARKAAHSNAIDILTEVRAIRQDTQDAPSAHSSALDTAFRGVFVEQIATLDIEEDDFSPVWSLLDAINLLSDHDCCEAAQGFLMIEDLMDAQTINGCRHVFNYLESRRERMTRLNQAPKKLTILRCCNELLRRLSRAEDTVLCGRVFIYLFQSFALGDKSSVNLRGEFHVENITTFDERAFPAVEEGDDHEMQLDNTSGRDENGVGLNTLYPQFWSLQSFFSSPTRLFEADTMHKFKTSIQATLDCFNKTHINPKPGSASVHGIDKQGTKRKRHDDREDIRVEQNASTFNPKYLTNRDLFDLEVHDIEFRRHVLVQSLILLDFLLSLTPKAKARLSGATRSKMASLYDKFTLNEEDKVWVQSTRKTIEKLLEDGNGAEGRYYLRMVSMVLSRDRNWTFWKTDGCPAISRPAVDHETAEQSQSSLEKITKTASLPLTRPKGSMQLQFLSDSPSLNSPGCQIPSLEEYHKSMVTDDLDMDFATDEEKKEIEERKAGKMWRALRSARGRRFALCEAIKNGTDMNALVRQPPTAEQMVLDEDPVHNAESIVANGDDTAEPVNEDGTVNGVETEQSAVESG